jgi:hypothetical protein
MKKTLKVSIPTLDKINEVSFSHKNVIFILKQTFVSVEKTLAEALFLCRNKCRNDTPVFNVYSLQV